MLSHGYNQYIGFSYIMQLITLSLADHLLQRQNQYLQSSTAKFYNQFVAPQWGHASSVVLTFFPQLKHLKLVSLSLNDFES